MGQEEQSGQQLQISLLGGFHLAWNGERGESVQTPLLTPLLKRLLAFLILHRHAAQSRQRVAFMLWPDHPEKDAHRNLRQALYRLRRRFPQVERFVHIRRKTLRWLPAAPYTLDVTQFHDMAAGATTVEALKEAVALYRGELLPGLYDEWIVSRREELHQMYLSALHSLVEGLIARGDYESAVGSARRLLEAERLREASYTLLLRLHIALRDRAAALRVYREAAQMLHDTFGVSPGTRLRALHQEALALPEDAATTGRFADNLPPQPTPFVGREEELAKIGNLLEQADCRLLTLIGLGGVGKSRLALEAARLQVPRFPDGVYFVSLSGTRRRPDLPAAIARALELELSGRASVMEQVLDALAGGRRLLLLDSFERVIEGAPALCELLEAAPELKLLATSRRALNIRWEWRFLVRGMAVPPRETQSPAQIAGYGAVALFTQIGRRIRPDFELTPKNAPAIGRICRQVEGLPLAVELAGAWLREFTPAEIANAIDENAAFLETPMRDMPQRQRTLYATFDYSWQMLQHPYRQVLACLSIFPAPFTVEAATAVAGPVLDQAEAVTGNDVEARFLSALEALVCRSLLRPPAPGQEGVATRGNRQSGDLHPSDAIGPDAAGQNARYEMHDLLQEYAHDRLAQNATMERAARDRHAAFYLHFVAAEQANLQGGDRHQQALGSVTRELDNIVAAWRHAATTGRPELVQVALYPLYLFLSKTKRDELGRRLFGPQGGPPPSSPQYGRCRAFYARFLYYAGRRKEAELAATEALERGRAEDDLDAVAAGIKVLTGVAYAHGDYERGLRLAEEGILLDQSRGDRFSEAFLHNWVGIIHKARFKESERSTTYLATSERSPALIKAARDSHRKALALSRAVGSRVNQAAALQNLGESYLPELRATDDPGEQASLLGQILTFLEEAASIFAEEEDWEDLADTLNSLGTVHARWFAAEDAAACFHDALVAVRKTERPMSLADTLVQVADLLWLPAGRAAEAAALLALVRDHEATPDQVRQRAKRVIAHAREQLSPAAFTAAVARGREVTLETAAQQTLQALNAWNPASE